MLNLYRLNYYTTTIFLLAGSVMVFGETDEINLPNTAGNSPKNAENKWIPNPKNNGRPYLAILPADNSNPQQPPPTGPNHENKNDTQEYRMYMQVAETILAMLRLSPLLAQEVQQCLNESKTFHEILTHLPRSFPQYDSALRASRAANSSKKVH